MDEENIHLEKLLNKADYEHACSLADYLLKHADSNKHFLFYYKIADKLKYTDWFQAHIIFTYVGIHCNTPNIIVDANLGAAQTLPVHSKSDSEIRQRFYLHCLIADKYSDKTTQRKGIILLFQKLLEIAQKNPDALAEDVEFLQSKNISQSAVFIKRFQTVSSDGTQALADKVKSILTNRVNTLAQNSLFAGLNSPQEGLVGQRNASKPTLMI